MQQLQHEVFEAMHIPDADEGLLDAINERGEACTPQEDAAMERFSAEFEKAYALVSSRQRAVEPKRVTCR